MPTNDTAKDETAGDDADAERPGRFQASKEERAAANAYWRLWRRNWRPPFRRGDAPGVDNG